MKRLLLLSLASTPLLLSSCGGGGGGGGGDSNTVRPLTLDGITMTLGESGTAPYFQFKAFIDQIGGNESGTFEYVAAGNRNFTLTDNTGASNSYTWPSDLSFTTYTYQGTGPNSGEIVITATGPGGAPGPLAGGTANPTTFAILFSVDSQGIINGGELVIRDFAFSSGSNYGVGIFRGRFTLTSGGSVPSGYRSPRMDQSPGSRPSSIAPDGIDGDVYTFVFDDDSSTLSVIHSNTQFSAPPGSSSTVLESGAALFTTSFFATSEEIAYSYSQPQGTDNGILNLSPLAGATLLPAPITLTMTYISREHGNFVTNTGRTGIYQVLDR